MITFVLLLVLITDFFFNGFDVTGNVASNLLSSTLLTISLNIPVSPGNLYTVVLQYAETGAGESVAGGRVAKTHFPIESWPKSHECPFPTVNDDNYKVRGGI